MTKKTKKTTTTAVECAADGQEVHITVDGTTWALSPDDARNFTHQLMQATQAAKRAELAAAGKGEGIN